VVGDGLVGGHAVPRGGADVHGRVG
jgi:hypothetical protein